LPAEETVPAAVQSTGEAVTATVVPAVGSVVEATVAAVVSTDSRSFNRRSPTNHRLIKGRHNITFKWQ
jgi:hypothetical protein